MTVITSMYNMLMSTDATTNLSPVGPQVPSTLTQLIQGTELLSYVILHVSYTLVCLHCIIVFTGSWHQTTFAVVTI